MDKAQEDVDAIDATARQEPSAEPSGEAVSEIAQEILTLLEATLISGDDATWKYVEHAWATLSATSVASASGPRLETRPSPPPIAQPSVRTSANKTPWAPSVGTSAPLARGGFAPDSTAVPLAPSPIIRAPAKVQVPAPVPAVDAPNPPSAPAAVIRRPEAASPHSDPSEPTRKRAATVAKIDPSALIDANVLPFVKSSATPPPSALHDLPDDQYGETLSDSDDSIGITLPFNMPAIISEQPVPQSQASPVGAGNTERIVLKAPVPATAVTKHAAATEREAAEGAATLPPHLNAMTIERYAALCAECALHSDWADRIAQRYNIRSRSEREAVDRYFRRRMQADQELLQTWRAAYAHYEQWARQGR